MDLVGHDIVITGCRAHTRDGIGIYLEPTNVKFEMGSTTHSPNSSTGNTVSPSLSTSAPLIAAK